MEIIQKYLTAIYDSKSTEADQSVNNLATQALKELIASVKANPSTRTNGDLVYALNSNEKYNLPRSADEHREKTRWEKFALEKGIAKKKKSRMVFSEKLNKWVPRYGSRSEQNLILQGGAVEVAQSFSKMLNDKKKRVQHNKRNQEKNKRQK